MSQIHYMARNIPRTNITSVQMKSPGSRMVQPHGDIVFCKNILKRTIGLIHWYLACSIFVTRRFKLLQI